uniref:DUF7920 domain-containing protein n=1 Tax=Globisporangium ultimum (strain ATCC 200006 / CBS 805.95 / DAOM BR144) TaxID=431595 RepID=K3W6D8_GLOUD
MIESAKQDTDRAHLVVHMRKGLQQMEAFMQQQHADGDGNALPDFEAVIVRESDLWRNHVTKARDGKDYGVQERILQGSLQVAIKGMDLKVGRPGRPDDAVYENSEYARKYMPRGNFIAEWRSPTSDAPLYFPIIRAYRKFTGQEDDGEEKGAAVGDELLSKFFTKPKEHARHVISTTKENGEAGHLSMLKRDDGAYLFALGSKNTHLVALSLDDIESACAAGRKPGNDPYKAASAIARALMKMIVNLSETHRTWLCEFLWQTRATASFEILCPDHQHVQLLDYIDEDTPVFYGLSLPSYTHMDGVEICVNPVLPYEAMRTLGIRTVEYKVVEFTPTLYAQTLYDIKNSYQHEGAVNLFLDDAACVIGMEKFKTVWYVSLRAIREKAKAFSNKLFPKRAPKAESAVTPDQALQNARVQMRKRFKAIQVYLQISSEVTDAYCVLGNQFVEFVYEHKLRGKSAVEVQETKRDVADLFPVVWKQFLETAELSDVVTLA